MKKFFAVTAAFLICVIYVSAQSAGPGIRQFGDLIGSGTVTLTATGNGVSSGFAVDGSLKNNTQNKININVNIGNGIYLKNSGKGQNMLAVQVFLSDGRYNFDGKNYFIVLPAGAVIGIVFNAFCSNFDLDNPSSGQTFTAISIPQGIKDIASRISKYAADNLNSDADYIVAAQLALWPPREIQERKLMKNLILIVMTGITRL